MALPPIRMRKRIMFLLMSVVVLTFLLSMRVAWLQVVDGARLKTEAINQQTRDQLVNSKRGTIYDRNGETLARSASADSVSVSPNQIEKDKGVENVTKELSRILELDYNEVLSKVKKDSNFQTIQRKISPQQAEEIRKLKSDNLTKKAFTGVNLYEDSKRYYPFGNLAANVLGFTGIDNQGLGGIELAFDDVLKGSAGKVISAKSARGTATNFEYEEQYNAKDGENLVLTIDQNIQHFVEKYLDTAVIENKLEAGAAAIVMNPKTGEIIAMATRPDFDPNQPNVLSQDLEAQVSALPQEQQEKSRQDARNKQWRNKAISDTYEPGSVFKILTASMGLEEGVVHNDDRFVCTGSIKVGPFNIRCDEVHGAENFVQGVANSCNPVFIITGQRVGATKFFQYFKNFNLTERTGIEVSGEAVGIFHPVNRFNEVELATSSFGQSFQITPIQMVSAISAVVNDGNYIKPHLVKEIRDNDDRVVKNFQPEIVRQVISKETSANMRMILEEVVLNGTGKNSYIQGYRIGGKTGTSEKVPRGSGKRIASFVGIAPMDDPQLVCMVMLDEPTAGSRYGGTIAAPVVGMILKDTLEYLGVQKQYTEEELAAMGQSVPDVRNMSVSDAKKAIVNAKLVAKISGNGGSVIDQLPKPGVSINQGSTIVLYTDSTAIQSVTVPNVVGLTAEQAKKELTAVGLNHETIGAGATNVGDTKALVGKQSPQAGTSVSIATVVGLEFRHQGVD